MTETLANRAEVATGQWRRRGSMVQDALLVVVSAMFVYIHASRIAEGTYSSIPFAIEQVILTALFLTRRRSRETSARVVDWLAATVGGWGALLMQPHPSETQAWEQAGLIVQAGGLLLTFAGFLSLGRSFGVVAANRGVKTGGMYRFVRHPIYLSHIITLTGFMMANPWPLNGVLYVAILIAQAFRMMGEERVLRGWDEYQAYAARVRWRLIPGVF